MHIVLISAVLRFSGLVFFEALLTYLQIGVDPTTGSWGNMINTARLELARDYAKADRGSIRDLLWRNRRLLRRLG